MKRKNSKIGIVAISLATVLFSQSVPMNILSAFAEELADVLTQEETIEHEIYSGNMVDKYNIGSGYIIQENVENRTATTKEFLMSDNTIMVQQFAEPIHYLENGEYKDIDNSLVERTEENKKIYKNTANSFKVKIEKGKNSFIEIEEDGYDLQFKYKENIKQEIKAKINNSEKTEKVDYKGKKHTRPKTSKVPSGQIKYTSIETDTDIIHTVKNNKLSNEIVISKSKEQYSYTFALESKSLKFEQSVDGSICASNASGQTKFIMPIPYMMDANGEYSNAITYTLIETESGLELTLTANAEWINQKAKFPITITPEIKSAKTNSLKFANIYEKGGNIVNADKIYVGKKKGAEKSDAFLSFKLPKVEPYYELIGASVNFEYETAGMGFFDGKDLKYEVYLAESTKDLSTVTYENKPIEKQSLNGIERSTQYATKTATYESDIINTTLIEDDTITLGIETAAETSEDSYIALATASETTSALYWYQEIIGLEDEYSIESFGVNGSTSYINNGTGQLTTVVDLASVNTMSDMPFEASLIYNDYYNELLTDIANQTGKTIPAVAGPCFKLNFQQFMIKHDSVFELIDADGSISTFSPCTTRGIYYSREKKLYYDSTVQVAYDLQGNKMYFNDTGCLTKIVSENNPTEYINIVYTTTYGEVDKVEYYVNSVKKYTIDFTYVNGRLTIATTDADMSTPLKKSLQYDEDGNLTSIKNHTGNSTGVQTLSFGYCRRYFDSDPVGMLNYIFDNQKRGIIFDRDHDDTIYEVRNMNAEDVYGSWRCCSNVAFEYNGIYTNICYYENNVVTNMRYVSFNNSKEVISEWEHDSKGVISVQASTNWKDISATGTDDYVKETYTYYHTASHNNDRVDVKNGDASTFQLEAGSLKVENHQNYSFAIIFKVNSNDVEDELLKELVLNIKIGDEDAQDIILSYGGSTYIVVPCDYYSEDTNVVITNRGSKCVSVQYFTYTLINKQKESYIYDTEIAAHKLSSTTTSLRSGHYSCVEYDEKQRISTEQTREISTDSVAETTTYSYYDASTDSNIAKGKIKAINTTKANSNDIDKTEYAYTGSWNNYIETVITTKNNDKVKTDYSINRGTAEWVVTQTDENNIQTKGYYKALSGDIRLWKVEYANTREEYTYNNLGQITNINVYEGSNGTPVFSQTDNYDENGIYLGSSYGGTKYTYGYDDTGFVTSIGYGGTAENASVTPLLQYSYYGDVYGASGSINSNQLYSKRYANGNIENYTYSHGSTYNGIVNKTQVDYKNTESGSTVGTYIYNYNLNGAMTSQEYRKNGYGQVSYNYGDLSNVEEQMLTIDGLDFYFEYTNHYDTLNNRIKSAQIYSLIGCLTTDFKTLDYTYNDEGQVSEFSYDAYDVEYAYDKMGRLTNRLAPMSYGYQDIQNEQYAYKTYGNGYTTNLLTSIDDQTNENNDRTATYDENGYVTSVSYNGKTYSYEYDGVGRLASETVNGATTNYSYNSANNITQAGNKTFLYDNQGRLVKIGSDTFSYDAMGNPIVYKGNTFTWEQGRKLASGTMNGKNFSYAYDGNGMRYEKKVNGVKTEYYYNDTQLLMESKNGQRTWYVYGVTGIEGMIVEGDWQDSIYYFDKNTLGDIIAIRDESGDIVARYVYDAWGNHTVYNEYGGIDYSATSIGNINPFRYRGYYYDNETGFYYLQTRYYDPTICRFINADNYELVAELSQTVGQLNLYAYANNNPIMLTDETGEGIWSVIGIMLTVLIFATSDSKMTPKQSSIAIADININGANPNGKIQVNIDNNAIEIRDSYKITEDYDRRKILEIIMASSEYSQYDYSRSINNYLAEWELHNHFYYMGIMKSNAQHVYLNRIFGYKGQLLLEKIAYGIYGFMFVG